MSQSMRQVLYMGQVVWVDENGHILGIAGGGFGGAEPGISNARERDIMSRLPDADIVGLVGPGVVPGGEQSIGARRIEIAQAAQPPPPHTYRPLAGSQVNNRGNVQTVTLPTLTGGPAQDIPSVVETAKDMGADAEVITVHLSMDLPPELTDLASAYSGVPVDVTAIVEWGVGNAFFSAEVDWNQGVSFAIAASFVRISARISAIAAFVLPDIQIVLRASLSYGNARSLGLSSSVRRTLRVGGGAAFSLGAGASSATFAIPPWAMGVTLIDAGTAAALAPDYTITFTDGSSTTVRYRVTSRTNLGNQVEGQFPIPGRSRFVFVTNNIGIIVFDPKLLFNLGI